MKPVQVYEGDGVEPHRQKPKGTLESNITNLSVLLDTIYHASPPYIQYNVLPAFLQNGQGLIRKTLERWQPNVDLDKRLRECDKQSTRELQRIIRQALLMYNELFPKPQRNP